MYNLQFAIYTFCKKSKTNMANTDFSHLYFIKKTAIWQGVSKAFIFFCILSPYYLIYSKFVALII